MLRHVLIVGLLLGVVGSAAAATVRWETRLEAAVQASRRTLQPLMLHVLGSREDRSDEYDRKQTIAFSDDAVVRAAQRFIPVRINQYEQRDLLRQLGVSTGPAGNQSVVWITPDFKLLDQLSAGGATVPESLIAKMDSAMKRYRDVVFEQIKPRLEDEEAEQDELERLFKVIAELDIAQADSLVVAILERPKVDVRLRKDGYEVLADLSTPPAVTRLFQHSLAEDQAVATAAARAIRDLEPPAAAHLFPYLHNEYAVVRQAAYQAIGEIAGVRTRLPRNFWEEADVERQKRTLAEMQEEAKEKIERYERKQREQEQRRRR